LIWLTTEFFFPSNTAAILQARNKTAIAIDTKFRKRQHNDLQRSLINSANLQPDYAYDGIVP